MNQNHLHSLCLALGLWVGVLLAFPTPGNAASNDPTWNLALSQNVPGKGGWTTCYVYACALQRRFTAAGYKSDIVIYNWVDEQHFRNCHAFLVYQDAKGRCWGMDDRSSKPRWLSGTTPEEWAAFWAPTAIVSLVADIPETDTPIDDRLTFRVAGTTVALTR